LAYSSTKYIVSKLIKKTILSSLHKMLIWYIRETWRDDEKRYVHLKKCVKITIKGLCITTLTKRRGGRKNRE
jgi:hypothetical protein